MEILQINWHLEAFKNPLVIKVFHDNRIQSRSNSLKNFTTTEFPIQKRAKRRVKFQMIFPH